jgi:zinc transporter 1/2/3
LTLILIGSAEAAHDHAAEEHAGHAHAMGCEIEPMADYNMPLRIGSLFIILVTSSVGKLTIAV